MIPSRAHGLYPNKTKNEACQVTKKPESTKGPILKTENFTSGSYEVLTLRFLPKILNSFHRKLHYSQLLYTV